MEMKQMRRNGDCSLNTIDRPLDLWVYSLLPCVSRAYIVVWARGGGGVWRQLLSCIEAKLFAFAACCRGQDFRHDNDFAVKTISIGFAPMGLSPRTTDEIENER